MEPITEVLQRIRDQAGDDRSHIAGWDEAATQPLSPDDGLPDCETCHNLRVVRYDVPIHDERFGRVFPCPTCGGDVEKQRRLKRYRELLRRIDEYGIIPKPEATFDALETTGRPNSLSTAKQAARLFARASAGKWLVLHGPVGTGKTHLAMAVANALRAQQQPVLLADAPGLLDLLRSGYDRDDYGALMHMAQTVDYLLIDDLGTEKSTVWAQEKLFQIINYRYNQSPPAALMVTMNECPETALSRRLASRLVDRQSKVIQVTGSDYRKERS